MLVGLDDNQKQIKNRWQFHCSDIWLSYNICANILPCLVIWLYFRWDQSGKSPRKGVNVRIFTVRNSSCGKVMFSQAGVKNSVHGGCIPACTGADTPSRYPSMHWGIHPSGQADTPPPDGNCSGQYGSYWNAFLFIFGTISNRYDLDKTQKLYGLKDSNK